MFHDRLLEATATEREYLLTRPILGRVLSGDFSLANYVQFLVNAYHHVRHTVPLMMAMGARLGDRGAWMLPALKAYIDEEIGHEQWIASDLESCTDDVADRLSTPPALEVEVMVSYVYDQIQRVNATGFLGMVLVLEGTSTALATAMADLVQKKLGLPDTAFSYLRSHGDLDVEHVKHFAALVNRIDVTEDQDAVIHVARRVYRLYANVLDQAGTAA
ncbi:MAG: iron-containing redox enzyme family protein [Pseudomonadales bacterium]